MINVFRKRIDRLIHGDDGAALVVTLALFMMMYISCAGVFAIGKTVKEKMILQNAADAAAYSAAIVQADTLSRIATLNREMALAYKDMVCRQMDYIVLKWLEDACSKYEGSGNRQAADPSGVLEHYITLRGAPAYNIRGEAFLPPYVESEPDIKYICEANQFVGEKILSDAAYIKALGDKIQDLIDKDEYERRVKVVIEDVLVANLPDRYLKDCRWSYNATLPDKWSQILGSDIDKDDESSLAKAEDRFLAFANFQNAKEVFGEQFKDWFPVKLGELGEEEKGGLKHECGGPINFFNSQWFWWVGTYGPYPGVAIFNHHDLSGDPHINVDPAKPLELKPEFYGDGGVRRGAISVGVAKYNRNPWEGLVSVGLDGRSRGLYEVFQPLIGAISWTWAIASAQAGYIDSREFPGDGDPDGLRANSYKVAHDYNADWKGGGDWNLRTDNWDAVYVPVCRSFTEDDFESWIKDDWEALSSNPASDPPSYSPDAMTKALPQMHNSGMAYAPLNWGGLLGKIYH